MIICHCLLPLCSNMYSIHELRLIHFLPTIAKVLHVRQGLGRSVTPFPTVHSEQADCCWKGGHEVSVWRPNGGHSLDSQSRWVSLSSLLNGHRTYELVIISALWYFVSTFSTAICLFRMYCQKWCNWTAREYRTWCRTPDSSDVWKSLHWNIMNVYYSTARTEYPLRAVVFSFANYTKNVYCKRRYGHEWFLRKNDCHCQLVGDVWIYFHFAIL